MDNSYEDMFHQSKCKEVTLPIKEIPELQELFSCPRLQRAVGVIYRPDTERSSHYYMVNLAKQFDSLLYIDETRAINPV